LHHSTKLTKAHNIHLLAVKRTTAIYKI